MFRTTRCASLLVGILAAFAGPHSTPVLAADAPVTGPHSIVAQSTKATAGTGRRPISQRIAASNLPLRAPSPPDCAEDACPDASIATDIAAPAPEIVAPAAAESSPPAPEQPDADTVAEAHADTVADRATDAAPDPAAAPPAAPTPASAPDVLTGGEAPEAVVVNAAANDAVDEAPAVVVPVAAPAQPAPSQPLRETLLKRIKGALGTRPRAPTPPAAGPGEAAVAAAPAPSATEPHAPPRPIPIQSDDQPAPLDRPTLADDAAAGATPEPGAVDDTAEAVPARLEFDVRESRSLVGEGEQIVMRIAVRNVGGETAERVTATLFFAEGIEPVQAIGQSAEVYPGEVRFEAVPTLSPGSSVDLLVTAVGTRPGSVTYRGELECRQLAGRIAREGAVTVRARRSAQP